jgi:hypothetical protein
VIVPKYISISTLNLAITPSEILKNDFGQNFNKAIYNVYFRHFPKLYLKNMLRLFHTFCKMDKLSNMGNTSMIIIHLFHDCVLIDTALLDVMYVKIEQRPKQTQPYNKKMQLHKQTSFPHKRIPVKCKTSDQMNKSLMSNQNPAGSRMRII